MARASIIVLLVAAALGALPAAGAQARPQHAKLAQAPKPPPGPPPADDLYRRRGYGQGGLVFGGGGQGGLAQAGACADLAFARPRNCGPRGGYGVYGNGLGYGFGF